MKLRFINARCEIEKQTFGLTRVDTLAIIFAVCVLVGWLGINRVGERGRMARCAQNLNVLGKLMQVYASEHGGSLPPASVERPSIAWDMQIAPYLTPSQVKNGYEVYFVCPSDPLERQRPRSYAMPAHDMTKANWPPSPDNQTGVGLSWNTDKIKQLTGDKGVESVKNKNFSPMSLVKLSWLPAPADTTILTELIDSDNILKRINKTTVSSPEEQQAPFQGKASSFHKGKFNYLMADGHVEALSALETGSLDGSGGIWTISKAH